MPCGLHKSRKPRRNAKENKNVLSGEERKGKEVIFLTFPCRAKYSVTGKNLQACVCKYMHTELFCSTQKRSSSIRKLHTEPPQILAPVPNPSSCLPFQSMSGRLHQLQCISGAVAEINSDIWAGFCPFCALCINRTFFSLFMKVIK